jgi:predicted glycogen debranching enzyme
VATQAPAQSAAPAAGDTSWITHRVALTPERGSAGPAALDQEWLITNGTGAYAMGTPCGVNTRPYHGLLIAATRPPVGRVLVLNQMLEQLVLAPVSAGAGSGRGAGKGRSAKAAASGQMLELSTLLFLDEKGRQVTAPNGYRLLNQFEKGLHAAWHYRQGEVTVTRELYLHWKEQSATLRYLVSVPAPANLADGAPAAVLRLSPMVTLRDFHAILRKDSASAFRVEPRGGQVTIRRDKLAATFACAGKWSEASKAWWYGAYYPAAAERGQDSKEDYFVPGSFEVAIPAGEKQPFEVTLTVALGERAADNQAWASQERAEHLRPIVAHLSAAGADSAGEPWHAALVPALAKHLAIASDDFVADRTVRRLPLTTILAGYPWFADWGRDTFIALPGLLLETGRFEEARLALQAYTESIRDGLVPNRFDDYDSEAAHYNTVDASLWYIRAALMYVEETGDRDCWEDWLGDSCRKIMDAYIRGTQFGIRMAGDGLITAGSAGTQLTWMDAACGGTVFTPRHGKAVEVNALWYYALVTMAEMGKAELPALTEHYLKLADRIKRSFGKMFWDEKLGYLRDHLWTDDQGGEHPDLTLRPNQVLALSLPVSPLPRTKQVQVLEVLRRRLLTPYGLRTLAQGDPNYHGRYTGGPFQRDQAYHQGTVWCWLIGPYVEAVLRCGDFSPEARREARDVLTPLVGELEGHGLGQLHEICEADPPHRAVGCMAQAWSVGELLRALRLIES